jgi:hypothetical protein
MRALICAASLMGLLGIVVWSSRPAGAQDDEKPTIKQIMGKLHKGARAPLSTVKAEMKKESPDWAKVEAEAIIIDKFGTFLPRAEVPRGDQAAFEKLAKGYQKNAKALKEASEGKDLAKAKDATKKLSSSCQACHTAHKPQ